MRIPAQSYQRGIQHALCPALTQDWVLSGLSEVVTIIPIFISFAKLVQVKLNNIHVEVKHRKVAVLLMVDTDRDGNQTDVDRLKNLLPKWGYDTVIQPTNPTRKDMIQALQSVQNLKGPYEVNFISFS